MLPFSNFRVLAGNRTSHSLKEGATPKGLVAFADCIYEISRRRLPVAYLKIKGPSRFRLSP